MPTLLLADDSVTIRRVIELTFANEDIRVVAVGDGQAAVQRIDADRPDIVLADVGMPKLDGYGVASHVKDSPLLKGIPVLLLTGAFEPVDEARARATGCDGILVKPFEPQQLIGRVKELLAGRKPKDLWPSDFPKADAEPAVPAEESTAAPAGEAPIAPRERGADAQFDVALAELKTSAPAKLNLAGGFEHSGASNQSFGDWDIPQVPPQADHVQPPAGPPSLPPAGQDRRSGGSWLANPAPVATTHAPVAASLPPLAPAAAPGSSPRLSMSSAFSALLAAEQALPPTPKPAAPPPSEAEIEAIVERVVNRMTGDAVRHIVLETAERLIREEIEKIKGSAD